MSRIDHEWQKRLAELQDEASAPPAEPGPPAEKHREHTAVVDYHRRALQRIRDEIRDDHDLESVWGGMGSD
jgi:hypothetical protein